VIRARDVVFTIEGSAKTPPFLSGPPIDWRWATTMSVQTTFFSALEERQRPDKGGVAMIKGCTHIYAPKGQTGEYATLTANHRGNGARPVPSGVRRVSPRYRTSSGVSLRRVIR
jgi:hypothetical protein